MLFWQCPVTGEWVNYWEAPEEETQRLYEWEARQQQDLATQATHSPHTAKVLFTQTRARWNVEVTPTEVILTARLPRAAISTKGNDEQ